MFPDFWKENCWNPTWLAPELASIKHSKIRVALIIIYQRWMTVVGYDTFFLCCKFLPSAARPGQRSRSWTIPMKPQKSLCGEMKKSPKFLDFCIIFEIHVLTSILHNQVLQTKKFSCVVHVLFVIIFILHSHTSISHLCTIWNLICCWKHWYHVLSCRTSDSNRADML